MRKIENWEEVYKDAKEVVEFDSIPVGPQIVKILKSIDVLDKEYLKLYVDIADGDYKGFFKEQYDRNTNEKKEWPFQGTVYVSYKKTAEKFFAAFIKAVEKSNKDFKWDFETDKLDNKYFVANYGEEEYESTDYDEEGNWLIKSSIKIVERRSLISLKNKEIKILPKKLFKGKKSKPAQTSGKEGELPKGNINNVEDDLPF